MDDQELREIRAKAGTMRKSDLCRILCEVIDEFLELRCAVSEREKADEAEKKNAARMKEKYDALRKDYLSAEEALTVVVNQLKLNNGMLFGTSSESAGELAKRLIRCTRRYFDRTAAAGQDGSAEEDRKDAEQGIRDILSGLTPNPVDEDAEPDPAPDNSSDVQSTETESAADEPARPADKKANPFADPAAAASGKEKKPHGRRPVDFQAWMDRLPHRYHFAFDSDRYDAAFGKGKWHFDNWIPSSTLKIIPAQIYVDTTYRPVIAPNDVSRTKYFDKAGDQPEGPGKLKPGAWASPSLLAYLIDTKYENSTALYSMEKYFQNRNRDLKRGWMSDWINDASRCYLSHVVKYLQRLMLKESCTQCDETPWEVIMDGRGPGSKGYFWVHTSSELLNSHRKIVFSFELTRATEHLRKFYGKDYDGVLEDDAFSAYFTYEKERQGKVTVATCAMHLRRRFVKAFLVLDKKGLTVEQLAETTEGRVISLIGRIYRAENPLKKLPPEQRLKGRQEQVKPLVDELFRLLHATDVRNPACSSYLADAVNYALKHEEHFRVFLTDPLVPIDNGFCERSLRVVSRGRESFLFSYSIAGAEASAVCYSLIQTAKANNAVPDIYLTYLLEELSKRVDSDGNLRHPAVPVSDDMSDEEKEAAWDQNWAFLETMMPWSEEYQAYEASYLQHQNELFSQTTVEKPCVRHGEIVYETISEEEAAKYDRRRMKRLRQRAEKEKEACSTADGGSGNAATA